MESGHRIFLVGVALLLLGLLVMLPAFFNQNLGLVYAGLGLSLIGTVTFILGIHIFMGQTTVEVRDILGLPSAKQMPARAPDQSEDAAPRRFASERMVIIIVLVSLLLTLLLFFFPR